MENDAHTTELDNVIKDTLSNYKTVVEVADWTRVENALTITPKKNSFNWKASIIVVVLIGLVIGGYFLYLQFPFTLSINKSIVTTPSEKAPPSPVKKTITPRPVSASQNKPTIVKNDSISNALDGTIAESIDTVVSDKNSNLLEETKIATTKNSKIDNDVTASAVEKTPKKQVPPNTESKKTEKLTSASEKNRNTTKKTEKAINTSDQNKNTVTKIESSATADSEKTTPVEKTPSKEEASKIKPRTTTPKTAAPSSAGWNTLMFSNINADSLKKYRERMKKDSVN